MYYCKDSYSIVTRHYLILVMLVLRFVVFIAFSLIILYVSKENSILTWKDIQFYVFFPFVFLLVNYTFFRLILWLISYYNHLFIIKWDQIFVINASLFLKDDLEIIEAYKIIKIDAFSRWFWSNTLGFWKIIIELQTKEERLFSFVPKPYELLLKLKEQREFVLNNRKKRYIIDEDK